MVKKKILPKQRGSSTTSKKKSRTQTKYRPKRFEKGRTIDKDIEVGDLIPYSPTMELLDEKFIALAIWECLKENDPEGVMEIIHAHLEAVNITKAAQEVALPRSSLYNALKGKNPTVKTLAKLVNCCS